MSGGKEVLADRAEDFMAKMREHIEITIIDGVSLYRIDIKDERQLELELVGVK